MSDAPDPTSMDDSTTDRGPPRDPQPPTPAVVDTAADWTPPHWRQADRGAVPGLILAGGGLLLGDPISGGLVAVVLSAVWLGISPIVTAAVAAIAISSLSLPLSGHIVASAGVGLLVIAPLRHTAAVRQGLIAAGVSLAGLGGLLAIALWQWEVGVLMTGGLLVVGTAIAGYGLHRYSYLRLTVDRGEYHG